MKDEDMLGFATPRVKRFGGSLVFLAVALGLVGINVGVIIHRFIDMEAKERELVLEERRFDLEVRKMALMQGDDVAPVSCDHTDINKRISEIEEVAHEPAFQTGN